MFLFCLVFAMLCARLFICASWSPAGKGLAAWLSFVVSSVSLSLSHWYPGSGVVLDCILEDFLIVFLGYTSNCILEDLIVSIPDLCNLTYFYRNKVHRKFVNFYQKC